MSSAGGSPSWQAMVSVGTSIVPPGPCPPLGDTPRASPAATTPQVTTSIHDFAASLPGHPGRQGLPGRRAREDPVPGRNKPESQKEANRAHAKLRSPGERANAQLKTWRILRKLRCCPWRAGELAKAIHVLQIREA